MPVRSIPAISRLGDLDIVLALMRRRDAATVDDVRIAIGQSIEELAARGEARQTRDWKHPLAYRDTAVDCLRELMRWNVIEAAPLADGAEAFEKIRALPLRLTPEGLRIATLSGAERRDVFGQRLLVHYPVFRDLLMLLEHNDVLLPELSDAVIKACFRDTSRVADDQDGWGRVAAACEQAFVVQSGTKPSVAPPPGAAKLTEDIGRYLRHRFLKRTPKNVKEVTGAANKAIAHAILRGIGFRGDWNAYDRCLRWGRDLYLCNDGRHVFGVSGWLSWSASKVRWAQGSFRIERRGVVEFRSAVRGSLIEAYRKIADARRSQGVQVPLIPIYEVRETTAFASRVCEEVVDRVLAEMASERSESGVIVQFHLGDLKDFVPSARPFRLNGRRYFYISMHNLQNPEKEDGDGGR